MVSVVGAPPRALFLILVQQHCEMPAGQGAHSVLQVLYDIAGGIGNAAKEDIAHRDVTPNNFGHWQGRGYLYDFSVAKVRSIPIQITV